MNDNLTPRNTRTNYHSLNDIMAVSLFYFNSKLQLPKQLIKLSVTEFITPNGN